MTPTGTLRLAFHDWPRKTPAGLLRMLRAMELEMLDPLRTENWGHVERIAKKHTRAIANRFPRFRSHAIAKRLEWTAKAQEQIGNLATADRELRTRLAMRALKSPWRSQWHLRRVDINIRRAKREMAVGIARRALPYARVHDPDTAALLLDRIETLNS